MDAPELIIRPLVTEDAAAYSRFLTQLDTETKFLLFEPGERGSTAEVERQRLAKAADDPSLVCFVVQAADEVVGFITAVQGTQNRTKHRAYLVTGVLEAYRRRGLGRKLFERIFDWGRSRAIERLELTVVTTNAAAVALYTKVGFEIEGTRRRSLRVDGQWSDEFQMAKLFTE